MKREFGLLLIVGSLIAFLINGEITGSVIEANNTTGTHIWFILSIVVFVFGILLFTSRQTLDAIIILGSPSEGEYKDRTDRALEEKARVYVVTGGKTTSLDSKYSSEAQIGYKELRKRGLPAGRIRAETRSKDTIGNLVNAMKKIDGNEIGLVSTPSHLDRAERIIEVGKINGTFDKNIRIHRIETKETFMNRAYEFIVRPLSAYRLRSGKLKPNEYDGVFKKILNYITKMFK